LSLREYLLNPKKKEVDVLTADSQFRQNDSGPVRNLISTTTEMILAVPLSIKEPDDERARKAEDSKALDNSLVQIAEWERRSGVMCTAS
jgi:hypothetical protein